MKTNKHSWISLLRTASLVFTSGLKSSSCTRVLFQAAGVHALICQHQNQNKNNNIINGHCAWYISGMKPALELFFWWSFHNNCLCNTVLIVLCPSLCVCVPVSVCSTTVARPIVLSCNMVLFPCIVFFFLKVSCCKLSHHIQWVSFFLPSALSYF